MTITLGYGMMNDAIVFNELLALFDVVVTVVLILARFMGMILASTAGAVVPPVL